MDLNIARRNLEQSNADMLPFQDPNLVQATRQATMREWTPLLQNSVGATQNMMGDFNQRFANLPYQAGIAGDSAASMTPQQKMAIMGRELGGMSGRLTASSALSDYLGGRAGEMSNRAMEALNFARQSAMDKRRSMFEEFQMAMAEAEAEKQRQFQARQAALARRGSGGSAGFNWNQFLDKLKADQQNQAAASGGSGVSNIGVPISGTQPFMGGAITSGSAPVLGGLAGVGGLSLKPNSGLTYL